MPISNLLTLRETATALKMHRHTLRKHMRAGMPHLRAPGARKVQFVLAECLAWLSASAAKQAAVAERESVRGRMRRLVAPGPKPLTPSQISPGATAASVG